MSKPLLLSIGQGKVQELVGTVDQQVPVWQSAASEWTAATSPGGGGVISPAQEYFVATNGNDATGDGSLNKPYATVGKAVTVANAVSGDTFLRINVAAGTYTESFEITRRNVLVKGAGCQPEEFYTKIIGTVTVNSTTCTEAFTQQIGLSGLFIQSSTTSPAVWFKGTGTVMLVIDDSYLYATNAAANVLLCESTAATRSIAILRNCVTLHGSTSASASIIKAAYGDIRFDGVRAYSSGSGSTGYGVEVLNSATLLADRLLVDVTTTVAAVFGSGSSANIKLLMSNSSVTNRGANANSHAVSVTNGTSPQVAAYLWQVLLSAFNASAKVVNGTLGSSLVYYGALTFGPNASGVINTSIASGVTQLPLTEKLGNLDAPLSPANGGTGLGAPAAGDVGKVLTAKADGTYELATGGGGGSGTVTSVGLTGGTSGIVIGGTASPITTSGTYNLDAPQIFQFSTAAEYTPTAIGQVGWNDTEGSLQTLMKGGNVQAIVGQQLYQRAVNDDTVTLTKGMVVYVFGSSGTRVTVKRALADADSTSATILGVVAESIAVGQSGFIMTEGLMKGLSVLPSASFTDGAVVYLSPTTPGGLTATKPTAPQHLVMVGYCAKTSNGSAGELLVKTQNGYELGELHDVYVSSPTSGQVLVYNGDNGTTRWQNVSMSGDATLSKTGDLTLANTAVEAASYGTTAAKTVSFTVDGKGRLTAASQQDISITASQISNRSTALVTSLTGTANQVTVSGSTGNVTLSLPSTLQPTVASSGTAFTIRGGDSSALSTAGAPLYLYGGVGQGTGFGGNTDGGNVYADGGAPGNLGTAGQVLLGTQSSTSGVTIGRSEITTTLAGTISLGALVAPLAVENGGTNNGSLSVAQGTVYYGDGTKLVGLAPGTSGHFLKTNGAGANPGWAAAGSASTPYDFLGRFAGNPASSAVLYSGPVPRAVTVSTTTSDHQFFASSLPSSGTSLITVYKTPVSGSGKVAMFTATWTAGQAAAANGLYKATIGTVSNNTLVAGDILSVEMGLTNASFTTPTFAVAATT